MPNLSSVNAAAVNAAAGGETLELSFTVTQQVSLRVQFSATQQVQSAVLQPAFRATQQVSLRVALSFTATQQVGYLQLQPAFTATQQVAAALAGPAFSATQRVQLAGALAVSATQRPAVVALLAGIDISARLTDVVEVDREAGQAASATLSFLPLGGAVDLAQWIGGPLTVDLDDGSGPVRVFTGSVTDSQYDPLRRVTRIDATDDLQRTLDALPRPVIDALTPGAAWSAAAADEAATGWAYAQDRMATLPADLDRDRWGALRVTPWAAAAVADWLFTPAGIVDETLRVEPGRWREMVNQVQITAEVRYTRRLHRERSTRWQFAGGVDTGGAMIDYLYLHATLPDEDMIRSAAKTNGWQIVSERFTQRSARGVYGGIFWEFNPATEQHPWQVLGADITAVRRWTQTITETYTLTVQAPASITRFGLNTSQDRATYSASDDQGGWDEAELPLREGGIGGPNDLAGALTAPNRDRYFDDLPAGARAAAVGAVLARGRVALLAAHRVHAVELTTPLRPGIDTAHTVRVETEPVTAQGRVRQVTHRLILGGEATTTVRLALSQSAAGAQADDALTLPAAPDTLPGATSPPLLGQSGAGGTHLGGYQGAPEFVRAAPYTADEDDPAWTGYVGNRDPAWAGSVTFDERFAVDWGEITRDPIDAATGATYRVAIPHDLLELAA